MLELHAIAEKKAEGEGEFAMCMTSEESVRFLRGINGNPKEYYNMLGTVNAERSDCSRPADRVSIHDGIRSSVGFVRLSRMVFGVLEEWMEGQLRTQALKYREAGAKIEAMQCINTLALVLCEEGRNEEALSILKRVLEFRRRALPADHPDIGDGHVWSAAACVRLLLIVILWFIV